MIKEKILVKKKILSILLVLLMLIPSANVFAVGNVDVSTSPEVVDELTTHVMTTGNDEDLNTVMSYDISIPADTKEIVYPINIPEKGILVSASAFPEEKDSLYLDQYIYSDIDCTEQIYYNSYDGKSEIPKAGTYYLKFKVSDYSDSKPTDFYQIGFASQLYSAENKTLENKQWACSGILDSKTPLLYKVVVAKTGSLTINIESEYSSYITLLDSKKKAISSEVYSYNGDKVCFAVSKGTYYIKATSISDIIRLKSTFSAITEKSGSTKAKAVKLTAGKTVSGCLTATNKKGTTDWYKITLTKSQKVEILFTGSVSSGKVKLEFFGGDLSGSVNRYIYDVDSDESFSVETWTSDKLPKGTYYIKVYKDEAISSGFYKLQLKK